MSPPTISIAPQLLERVNAAIADVRAGKMVILVDDEDREERRRPCAWPAEFVTARKSDQLHGERTAAGSSASR